MYSGESGGEFCDLRRLAREENGERKAKDEELELRMRMSMGRCRCGETTRTNDDVREH